MAPPLRAVAVAVVLIALVLCTGSLRAQTIFEDDFDDNAANWTFESLTGNFGLNGESDVLYGFDYSALGIPEAPNSAPGDTATSGVRLRTNLAGRPTDQAAIYLEDVDFSGKYTVQVDMWLNWPPDPEAVGTTIHAGPFVGGLADPGDAFANTPVQVGAGYLASTDGDCSNCDHILLKNRFELDTFSGQYTARDLGFGNQPGLDNTDSNADPLEGALFDMEEVFPSLDIDTVTGGAQNSQGTQQPAGAVAFRWVTVTAEVDPTAVGNGPNSSDLGTTTFSVLNNDNGKSVVIGTVDNSQPDILDDDMDGDECDGGPDSEDICINLNNPLDGDVPVDMEGRVSLVLVDFFAGAGSNVNFSFALFDNIRVFETTTSVPGDFNGDGNVDILDLDILSGNFGTMGGAVLADGDANGDGNVDILDLDILSGNFGQSSPSAAIPEPTTAALLCLITATCASWRPRKS